jgi:mannose-1-phosphate guanylyltransferase/mannose-6-phosphate isomerase
MTIHPVILSGGSGTRLWPLSRESFPKQLHNLFGERSLLQETARRVAGMAPPLIVCNDEHRFVIGEQLREAGVTPRGILLEPVGRNTAPAAAAAALMLDGADEDARILMLPSDHHMRDPEAFLRAVGIAAEMPADALVCFGVAPDRPHTGYGYIRRGEAICDGAQWVERFVEKPDAETARHYVESDEYLWNAGIFLLPVARYLEALGAARPQMLAQCRQAVDKAHRDLDFTRLDGESFAAIKGESIDYAVMETAERVIVVGLDAGWSDVGSWSSLHTESPSDDQGNSVIGDVTTIDCRNSYLRSDRGLVAAIGLDNIAVVATGDAVLVTDKNSDQSVTKAVAMLKAANRREAVQTLRDWRPWGWFETLVDGPRFHVKQLQVDPGHRLSLQMHYHRSEHWVVVEGAATVTRGDETFLLHESESAFIPAGTKHRLANEGKLPLKIVEIQVGAYFGEDDIIRLTDDFGRREG